MGARKPLKCDEIIEKLNKQYNISANRKTIYDDIAALTCFVNVKHWRHDGYWVEKGGLTMPRYIDADLILPEMESKLDMQELYLPAHFQEFIVDEIPTADVAPVRHGHWIINSDGYYPQCSECMSEPRGREMTKYCGECGAKMDGDKYARKIH